MKSKVRAMIGINLAMIVAIAALLFAGPAQAYPSSCASGSYICYYDDTAGTVKLSAVISTNYGKSLCYSGSSITDAQKSGYISNPSGNLFWVYLNTTCSGTYAPIYAHSSGAMNSTWNNKIRSLVRAS